MKKLGPPCCGLGETKVSWQHAMDGECFPGKKADLCSPQIRKLPCHFSQGALGLALGHGALGTDVMWKQLDVLLIHPTLQPAVWSKAQGDAGSCARTRPTPAAVSLFLDQEPRFCTKFLARAGHTHSPSPLHLTAVVSSKSPAFPQSLSPSPN